MHIRIAHSLCPFKNKKTIPYGQVVLLAIHEDVGGPLLNKIQQKGGKGKFKTETNKKDRGNRLLNEEWCNVLPVARSRHQFLF